MKKITPVLCVDAIEPALAFWVDRLGFAATAEVPDPDDGSLAFVILEKDGVELMYQTRNAIRHDVPALGEPVLKGTFLFIEVADLDAVEKALEGITPVTPRRKTFYGSDELIVLEPGGNAVTFAQFGGIDAE